MGYLSATPAPRERAVFGEPGCTTGWGTRPLRFDLCRRMAARLPAPPDRRRKRFAPTTMRFAQLAANSFSAGGLFLMVAVAVSRRLPGDLLVDPSEPARSPLGPCP